MEQTRNVVQAINELAQVAGLGVTFLDDCVSEARFLTYAEILHESKKLASFLLSKGVSPGDRVALMLPNNESFYYAFLGALLIKAIPVAIYPPIRLAKLNEWETKTKSLLRSVSPKLLLSELGMASLGHHGISEFPFYTTKEREKHAPISTIPDISNQQACFIQFSSGTTSHPKPIVITHENVAQNIRSIVSAMPEVPNGQLRTLVSWLPLYHDMGLVGCMLVGLFEQGHLVLLRPERFLARPALWLEALSHYKAHFSVAPNFAFGLCLKRIKSEDTKHFDLSALQVLLCGAETIHGPTLREFSSLFQAAGLSASAITPVYGLAEATLAVTFSSVENVLETTSFDQEALTFHQRAKPSNADGQLELADLGVPVANVKVRIFSPDGRPLAEDQLGEVCVQGPSTSPGIFSTEKGLIPHDNFEGYLRTGDQGFMHQGHLYLWGRIKDVVIVHGKNYDAQALELCINSIPGLRKGRQVIFGTQDQQEAEQIYVLAEVEDNKILSNENSVTDLEDQIRQKLLRQFSLKVNAITLLHQGTLPRTSSGKLKRAEAKRLFLQNRLQAPPGVGSLPLMFKAMVGAIKLNYQRIVGGG